MKKTDKNFVQPTTLPIFAMLQDGSCTYSVGQAVTCSMKYWAFFVSIVYWRLPIRKYCNALRSNYHLVAAYMAAASLLPKLLNL